jgi:pimeloyl-ACP methyl ester carboxylesterase
MQMTRMAWAGFLVAGGLITHAAASAAPAASTQMIENAGHKIAFHVTPGHPPIIVLDAGGGLDSSYWDALVPELARQTGAEIITYDRAGFGASDEVPGPWSLDGATDDLAKGLETLGATHDVVLVAHSVAAEIATSLALRHPDWIAGAVLVDGSVPQFYTDAEIAKQVKAYAPAVAAAKAAPPTKETRQLLALAGSFAATSQAYHRLAWPQSIPVTAIVSEKTPFDTPTDARLWHQAEAAFAKGAKNRKLVVAKGSSHDIAHDRPDIVLQGIGELVSRIR